MKIIILLSFWGLLAIDAHADGLIKCQGQETALSVRVWGRANGGYAVTGIATIDGLSRNTAENNVTANQDSNGTKYFVFTVLTQSMVTARFRIDKNGFQFFPSGNQSNQSPADEGSCENLGLLGF